MDESRQHDMVRLHEVLNDPAESERHKRQARRSIDRIKARARDPFIRKERERLIKAQRASDADEVEKISSIIHDYAMRTYGSV